jgi:hypothetical protein
MSAKVSQQRHPLNGVLKGKQELARVSWERIGYPRLDERPPCVSWGGGMDSGGQVCSRLSKRFRKIQGFVIH